MAARFLSEIPKSNESQFRRRLCWHPGGMLGHPCNQQASEVSYG